MTAFETPALLVPPLTPFDKTGKIDQQTLHEQIDYVIDFCDPTALVIMGVETQEFRYLTIEERIAHIRDVATCVDGRVPLVVGISARDPADAIRLGQVAESVGARAVQALVPTRVQGGETRRHDVIGYFRRIGAELDIPVVAYHNPRTGAALIPEDVVALAELDSVVAFKESSRNMRHVLQLIDSVDRSGRAQYLTTMELLVPSIVLGGSGTTMPPPAAELGRKTIDAFETGDMRTAIELQHEFGEFPSQWLDWGLASVLKAAFGYFGVDIGSHPATSGLSDTAQSEVEAHMKSLSIDGPRRQ